MEQPDQINTVNKSVGGKCRKHKQNYFQKVVLATYIVYLKSYQKKKRQSKIS